MHQEKNHRRSRRRSGKSIALLVSLILIVCVTIGGTIAFLIDTDDPIQNLFDPSEVTTKVEETFEGGEKTNVSIKNTGDIEAYIRAAVVITWKDADGNVYGQAPVAGEDYTIMYATDTGWKMASDGFWYYTTPVAVDANTGYLIISCTDLGNAPEGYFLSVEIIGSGIQSKPDHVVTTVWSSGVSRVNSDATLVIKEPTGNGG